MSTPPLLLYTTIILLRWVVFFSSKGLILRVVKKKKPNYTTQQQKPIQLRSSNRLIYEFFMKKKVLCKDKPFTPSLSIKLQVPIIYLQTVSFFLFASACYKVVQTQNCYLQWWTKVWYVLYYYYYHYYYYLCYIFFFTQKLLFFVAIKQHPHLLQTYND